MTFKSFERSHLGLSVITILSSLTTSLANAQATAPASPATAEACVALASNADRLACYDRLLKHPPLSSQWSNQHQNLFWLHLRLW